MSSTPLMLKRTFENRWSGDRSDDDYDVVRGDRTVGRIFLAAAAPKATPWMWSIYLADGPENQGFAATRMDAMAKFRARWEEAFEAEED